MDCLLFILLQLNEAPNKQIYQESTPTKGLVRVILNIND